jgi:actin-like ATPase involved in cell morphogenesis
MIWDNILGWFSTDMGIDLGTATTLVCVQGLSSTSTPSSP